MSLYPKLCRKFGEVTTAPLSSLLFPLPSSWALLSVSFCCGCRRPRTLFPEAIRRRATPAILGCPFPSLVLIRAGAHFQVVLAEPGFPCCLVLGWRGCPWALGILGHGPGHEGLWCLVSRQTGNVRKEAPNGLSSDQSKQAHITLPSRGCVLGAASGVKGEQEGGERPPRAQVQPQVNRWSWSPTTFPSRCTSARVC